MSKWKSEIVTNMVTVAHLSNRCTPDRKGTSGVTNDVEVEMEFNVATVSDVELDKVGSPIALAVGHETVEQQCASNSMPGNGIAMLRDQIVELEEEVHGLYSALHDSRNEADNLVDRLENVMEAFDKLLGEKLEVESTLCRAQDELEEAKARIEQGEMQLHQAAQASVTTKQKLMDEDAARQKVQLELVESEEEVRRSIVSVNQKNTEPTFIQQGAIDPEKHLPSQKQALAKWTILNESCDSMWNLSVNSMSYSGGEETIFLTSERTNLLLICIKTRTQTMNCSGKSSICTIT
jgi:ElaB/YqjD/DUF883 family membrane-anchored ribosome-binding protein